MWKKSLLIICCFVTIFCFLVLPCSAAFQGSVSFVLNSRISSIVGGTKSVSGDNTVISFSSNNSANVLILVDLNDFGFLSGESYTIECSFTCSSSLVGHSKCYFGLSNKLMNNGVLPDNITWFYENKNVNSSLNLVNVTFSIPSDFVSSYLFIELVVNNASSISSGNFTFSKFTLSYVEKKVDIDNGEWSGDLDELPSFEGLDDFSGDFQDNWSSAYDFLHNGFLSFRSSVLGVSLLFGQVWASMETVAPELIYILIFSIVGGAFCLVVFKRR